MFLTQISGTITEKKFFDAEEKKNVTETRFFKTIKICHRKLILQNTSFHHRNRFLLSFFSEKQISITEKVFVTDKSLCLRKSVYLRIVICPQIKVSVRQKSFCHRSKLIGT